MGSPSGCRFVKMMQQPRCMPNQPWKNGMVCRELALQTFMQHTQQRAGLFLHTPTSTLYKTVGLALFNGTVLEVNLNLDREQVNSSASYCN